MSSQPQEETTTAASGVVADDPSEVRRRYLASAKSLVVKLGSQLLSDKEGRLDAAFLTSVATQVAELKSRGVQVTIVSSGAIAAGLRELNLPKRPTDLGMLQAVAAVGQRRLMDGWAAAFAPHKLPVAQILLTREDIDERSRFLNLRNTVNAIHAFNAVPIINENDTISTDELVKLTFGDNDILAALVTHALRADVLCLLSVVDGVLDEAGQPRRVIEEVAGARSLVRVDKSSLGKGGMNSKLNAAQMVTGSGEAMVVAHGRMENILPRLLAGEMVGTLFVPAARKRAGKNRWIGAARPAGLIHVDDGAAKAVGEKNRSLLPAGIAKVEGTFGPGDVVGIVAADGTLIARGLTNYASADIERIKGMKSPQVRSLLAEEAYDEVIHRDNMVLE
ncbi:glutamate 5-kinase [Humisphaera borealis]|uniref:Glutamate 5-kinase n=1 Tax=Humisphaera borealis TaxID=2807512 RepID=A0A7M2WQS3_9BACT|nr:glutamate 5-kinase [Humisphaera borealis]QOV87773.1 glutamate 5-kinase [Humisphaera borealis]